MCERISRTHFKKVLEIALQGGTAGQLADFRQIWPREVGQQVMNAADHYVLIEFCCPICLRSIRAPDTYRIPRCERCLIRMEPDSDEPPRRSPTRPVMAGRDRE
jgi:hypothetical protein